MKEEKMVKDYSKPADCYSQKFDQAPLNYMERTNKREKKEAGQIKNQSYKGRYK